MDGDRHRPPVLPRRLAGTERNESAHEIDLTPFEHRAIAKPQASVDADGEKNAFATFFGYQHAYRAADKLLREGERLPLGNEYLTVLHTPGHTKGSVCYLSSDETLLLSGDTLFAEGYGRYDLYGGNGTTLAASLRRLSSLRAQNPILASGHGDQCRLADALNALGL